MFYRKFRWCSAHLKKLQYKEKSEKCEINCRPSVLRSPTVHTIQDTRPPDHPATRPYHKPNIPNQTIKIPDQNTRFSFKYINEHK